MEGPWTYQCNAALKSWLEKFLDEFAGIYSGASPIGTQLPDEKFIQMLESTLHQPIYFTMEELEDRYSKLKIKVELDQWMRGKGRVIVSDPEGVRDNLEKAAKFACYALVNKLVFHEALLKRYGRELAKLSAPDHIDQGEKLRLHLARHFQEAKKVTDDYETVFGETTPASATASPFTPIRPYPTGRPSSAKSTPSTSPSWIMM